MSEKQWFTVDEASEILRVHPETIRRHASTLDGVKIGGVWRFPASSILSTWRVKQEILAQPSPEAVA